MFILKKYIMRKISVIKVIFTLMFLISFSTIFGQKNKEDVIYLKDGSIIRGSIIEYISGKHVKIETRDKNIWVFNQNKIDKISLETRSSKIENNTNISGYFNLTDMGLLVGTGNNDKSAPFSINMLNGYRYNQNLTIGLGTGIEFFSTPVIPIYFDTRYTFFNNEFSPFIYLKAGYSLQIGENSNYYHENTSTKGGQIYGAGIGLKINLGKRSDLVVSMGYRHQKLNYSYYEEWTEDEIDRFEKFNRFAIRVGFAFK